MTLRSYHRHGIRIILRQTGTVGAFSAGSVLVTCTTSLGLFAVATLVVDQVSATASQRPFSAAPQRSFSAAKERANVFV